ncbi:hypothetical protein ACW0KB_12905 [Virgibacillus salarius]|nr:hypothetical protein [uncultured Virgibacillus sp.]
MGGFVFPHGWLVPQGYDLKALKPIGHLLAVVHTYPYWVHFIA